MREMTLRMAGDELDRWKLFYLAEANRQLGRTVPAAPSHPVTREPVILKAADGDIGPVVLVVDDDGGTGMRQGMGF